MTAYSWHTRGRGRSPNPTGRNTTDETRFSEQPRCSRPRCRNMAAACCGGLCWTCKAKDYERRRNH